VIEENVLSRFLLSSLSWMVARDGEREGKLL
jgi:hypothetical protein